MADSTHLATLSKTDSPLILEAENFSVQPRIGQIQNDGFLLWSNGQIGDSFEISESGNYNICVTASGTQVGHYAPNLAIVVDGKSVVDFKISEDRITQCSDDLNLGGVNLTAGQHYLALAYTNDYDEYFFSGSTIFVDKVALKKKNNAAAPNPITAMPESSTLREVAKKSKILIGTAVRAEVLETDPTYAQLAGEEFNLLTSEFNFKPHAIWQGPGRYEFGRADEVALFAKAHGMKLKGHTLLWDREDRQQIPGWLSDLAPTRSQAIVHLRDYIHAVVGHFKGRVGYWDVVNEALNNNNQIREGFWQQTIGDDYIRLAFEFAHEADPNAKLFYNDYGCAVLNEKSDAIYELIKSLKKKGVPIHGIGLQTHESWDVPLNRDDVIENMQRFAALGLEIHINEMDVALPTEPTPLETASQDDIYRATVKSCLAVPACKAITTWGVTDNYWWYKDVAHDSARGLLFDEKGQRKSSYEAVLQELSQARSP